MDAVAGSSSGVVLSETQLGNMALRAKQQRFKAEQDRQLLQVRCLAAHDLRTAWSVLI